LFETVLVVGLVCNARSKLYYVNF